MNKSVKNTKLSNALVSVAQAWSLLRIKTSFDLFLLLNVIHTGVKVTFLLMTSELE